jgi:hypothetical protein
MHDHMDRLLKQLTDAPLPRELDRLEADVLGRINSRAETLVAPSWQVAAVGVALIVGIGVGSSSAVTVRNAPGDFASAVSGGDLAPSSLLAAS